AYAWAGHGNTDRAYGVNGLNQATSAGPTTIGHDARGNVTSIESATYGYDSRNLLSRYNDGTAYNTPLDQLFDVSGEQRRLMRSGDDVLSEVGYDGLLKHRYV
ncbi:hypothetical protein, partial [Streptobacillus moniliformis]|uniref:hypothetical protein n=1 Tax=Streptobacillus moniliformis TaxID=34105 RepID=UPI0018C8BF7D